MESHDKTSQSANRLFTKATRTRTVLLLTLMVLHFLITLDTLRQSTPTVDEVAHLPAGLTYLQRRDFRLYPHNPPLVRLLAAIPATFQGLKVTYEGTTWARHTPPNHWLFACRFLIDNAEIPSQRKAYLAAFTGARTVIALLSAMTLIVLFIWGRWWFGEASGWIAATLWAFSPNVIAHAGFVTTDLASASIGVWSSFFFAVWLQRRTFSTAATAGLFLGLAQLVKFSCLLLYPIWLAWLVLELVTRHRQQNGQDGEPVTATSHPGLLRTGTQFVTLLAVSVAAIDAGYLFQGSFKPLGGFHFVSQTLTRLRKQDDPAPAATSSIAYNMVLTERINRFTGTFLGRLPTPFPSYYVSGFDEQKFESEGKYPMYLRGEFAEDKNVPPNGRSGWWYYYLYALAIKLPLGTLALVVLALARQVIGPRHDGYRWSVIALLFGVPLAGMSLLTDINIGLRYTLPIFPYLFLLAGTALRNTDGWVWRGLVLVALIGNCFSLYHIHPHELSYFNELVGGPKNGRFHLIDSNLDWGQDLRHLGRWLEEHPDWRGARLAYFGSVPPEFEGITDYRMAPRLLPESREDWLPWESLNDPASFGPQPGRFIVSVNFERGLRFHTPAPLNQLRTIATFKPQAFKPAVPMINNERGAYQFFRKFTPVIDPTLGYSLLLYDITLEQANTVREELGLPDLPQPK